MITQGISTANCLSERSVMHQIRVQLQKRSLISAALLILIAGGSLAQTEDQQLPMLLDADSTDYDGKSSMLMFRGLRLTQGNIGIQADEGRASKLDFEDSIWQFSGNVVIDVENGHIECTLADLEFSGNQLKFATITGEPATFEMKRPDTEGSTYAEAERLEYDFSTGIVSFSGNATISEGGNQISSAYLVYNIAEQRINAQSGGNGDDKVRITYTPGEFDGTIPDVSPSDLAEEATPDETGGENNQ